MAPKQPNSFEKRYFDQLDRRFDSIDKAVETNTQTTEKGFRALGGRVGKLEKKVFPDQPQTVAELPSVWRNPEIRKIALYFAVALLVIALVAANLTATKLPGGLNL